MKRLYLSEAAVSKVFWSSLLSSSDKSLAYSNAELIVRETKLIHQSFPQDTAGSISLESTAMLWLIAKYFCPSHVFEIGTFIGRSAFALIAGAQSTIQRFDTCDYTFDQFKVTDALRVAIPKISVLNYWPKTSSTQALSSIVSEGARPDLFFIDGRLNVDDLRLLQTFDSKMLLFVLDDFEGIEKGVENCIALRKTFPDLLLIRPHVNLSGQSLNTAILLPRSMLMLSRQQELPIAMQ